MNKLLSKIAALSVGLAMAVGVGVAVGSEGAKEVRAETVDYTSIGTGTGGTDSESRVTNVWTLANGGITITQYKGSSSNDVVNTYNTASTMRVYKDHIMAIEANTSSGYAIVGVKVTCSTNKSYYGGDYKVNTEMNSITQSISTSDTTNLTLTNVSSVSSGAVSSFIAKSSSGVSGIYWSYSKQQRPSAFTVSYIKPDVGSPTEIVCATQEIDVTDKLELDTKVSFVPQAASCDLSYSLKSGSDYIDLDTESGLVVGKKGGTGVVTITPADTSGGATAIDVTINVSSIEQPAITVGKQYAVYAAEGTSHYELTGISSNLGTATSMAGDVPSCTYLLTVEEGVYENTVALKNDTDYISYSGSGNNVYTSKLLTAESSWIVVLLEGDNNEYAVTNVADKSRLLQFNYNSGNPRFACYQGTQNPVSFYSHSVKPLEDFSIEESVDVYLSATRKIAVTYDPADASDKTLEWASNNEGVATVLDGVVTGVSIGTTTVTATATIGGNPVVRSCTVNVLNNVASHEGDSTDPFSVNDAVNVTKGIFTKVKSGAPVDLSSEYYVKGMITRLQSGTVSNFIFWIGDNASQTSVETGGFEIFKASEVVGKTLAERYNGDNDALKADFAVGYHVVASGTFVYYNETTPEITSGGKITWNSFIEATGFAETFLGGGSSSFATCANTISDWTNLSNTFDELPEETKSVLANATHKAISTYAESVDMTVEHAVARYDDAISKNPSLDDFMERKTKPSYNPSVINPVKAADNNYMIIVVIASAISLASLSLILVIRKRRHIK